MAGCGAIHRPPPRLNATTEILWVAFSFSLAISVAGQSQKQGGPRGFSAEGEESRVAWARLPGSYGVRDWPRSSRGRRKSSDIYWQGHQTVPPCGMFPGDPGLQNQGPVPFQSLGLGAGPG